MIVAAAADRTARAVARARAACGCALAMPVVAVWAFLLVLFTVVYPALDPGKSPRPIAEAAAALTPEGGSIGLVGDVQMAGGLVYYGRRHVEALDDAASIERFLAAGGRAIVVEEKKRERVDAVTPVDVRFRAREGSRARAGRDAAQRGSSVRRRTVRRSRTRLIG